MVDNPDIYNPFGMYDSSNEIHETAIIYPNVVMGKNNKIGAYTVIGSDGEIRNCKQFQGGVVLGDGNVISELVTIQRPPAKDAYTRIGNNNIIMAHAHIGHDVQIGDNCEICTGVILGGYVKILDWVKIKLGSTIRNRKSIGARSLVGMGSVVVKDVQADETVIGNPARPYIKK